MSKDPSAVTALRDHLQALLDEDLPEAHLTAIWPTIETEWLRLFPETQPVLAHLKQYTGHHGVTNKALETLIEVCDRHLGNLNEAAGYRQETQGLKQAAEELLRKYDAILNKKTPP